jgi:hypothetical protein
MRADKFSGKFNLEVKSTAENCVMPEQGELNQAAA